MTNYREILRLNSLGLNKTQIAEVCDCSRTTVIKVLELARIKRLSYPAGVTRLARRLLPMPSVTASCMILTES